MQRYLKFGEDMKNKVYLDRFAYVLPRNKETISYYYYSIST